jgi:hypothetical protein
LTLRRGLAFALALASLAPAARAEIDVPRAADCLLIVGDQKLIGGRCTFTPLDAAGSFTIAGLDGLFFAYVLVTGKGEAEGYWNGTPRAQHAHEPLGKLRRDDACWVNDSASVCAW